MLDELDKKLILELQKDGRKNYTELASILGVVEGTIRRRVKRLIDQDLIKIVAIPNIAKLGYALVAMMGFHIRMENLRQVADKISKNQCVCYSVFVTGRYDLMAIVISHSPQELSQLIENEFSIIPGVQGTETFICLDMISGIWGLPNTIRLTNGLEI